ncbi:MAG: D-Ala-D-Ala carboxypeptidase family metallohydrolase [Paracoccus sp. (in: a-proteobacteria)]|nr:D-Ala-D-Ala carboxypeptidase family metallohydrolase [Paracoccus sp. (in: a-proteobacteria)]
MTLYRHWREVPPAKWRWPNFWPAEIACRGTDRILVNEDALDRLQSLRDALGRPLIVNSAYRSPEHNTRVGGAKASKHLSGTAFDVSMANHDPASFITAARKAGFAGIGTYPRSNFIHIDTGPARTWGDPFPPRPTRFAPEQPAAREHLAESRTMQGAGAAGVATIGTAAVDVARDALAEAQGAVQPLIPWLDSLRWLFLALALGGIALAIYARLDDWKRGRR